MSVLRALCVGLVLWAPAAFAVPLALDLETPRLSFALLLGQSPPPVVLPEGGASLPATAPGGAPGYDHLRLNDGRQLQGKILEQVQGGFLFHDATSNVTFVIPFDQIADLQRAPPPQLAPPPAQLPVPAGPVGQLSGAERRFFLESSLRDLQGRYAALSLWPGIEELIGAGVGIASFVLILVLAGTDTLDLVFATICGVVGVISAISGIAQIVSVENRKAELGTQIAAVEDELGRLPHAGILREGAPLAFRF